MQTMAPVLELETSTSRQTVIQFSDRFDAEPYRSLCGRTRHWAAAAGYAYHAETERGLPTYSVYWEKVRMGLEALELGRVALAEAEGVEAEVAGGAVAGLAAGGGGDAGDHLNGGDHDEGEGNVLGVRVPQLPEGVHLALGGGGLAAGGGAEDLDLENAGDGEHGHTGVLELGLAHPVEIDTDLIDLRKAEGVKANITGHGSVELRTFAKKHKHSQCKPMFQFAVDYHMMRPKMRKQRHKLREPDKSFI